MKYKKTMRIYLKKRFFYLIKILNILFGNFQISMLKMTYVYNITIFADVKQNQFENKETKKKRLVLFHPRIMCKSGMPNLLGYECASGLEKRHSIHTILYWKIHNAKSSM